MPEAFPLKMSPASSWVCVMFISLKKKSSERIPRAFKSSTKSHGSTARTDNFARSDAEKFIAPDHHSSINKEPSRFQDDSSQFLKLLKKLRHIGIFPPYFLLRIPFETCCSEEFFFLQSLPRSYDTGASIISLNIPIAHSVYVGESNLIRLQGF